MTFLETVVDFVTSEPAGYYYYLSVCLLEVTLFVSGTDAGIGVMY